jgi:hypothetical protein
MDATSNLVSTGADLAYLNGYGGRYGFGYGHEWANDTTNQHTANFNREATRNENSCTRSLFDQAMRNIEERFEDGVRRDENARVCDKINDHDQRNNDSLTSLERRLDDKLAAIAKEQADSSKEALKQFCDLKEQHKETQKAIEVTSLETENRDLREQLAEQRHRECCPAPARCVDPCCNGGGSGGGNSDTQVILQAMAQQFQSQGQMINSGLQAVAEAIKGIDTNKPGNS